MRDFHTAPIEEVADAPYSEMVTESAGDILSTAPSYRNQPNDPKFAVYMVNWTKVNAGSAGGVAITVGEMLGIESDHPTDVEFYASYEVTVRLAGKERTYQAMALYHRPAQSGERRRVEIHDNITPAINAVLEEDSPVVRSPWRRYVTSGSYFATMRTIKEATERGIAPIPEDAAIGSLPGDDAVPSQEDLQKAKLAAAASCQACVAGGTPVTVTSLSPAELHVSTGDAALAHMLSLQFTPPDVSVFFNFPVTFRYNYGGVSNSTLNVPSNYGFPPVTTTVKAEDASNSPGSSGVFGVRPECGGQVFPQESTVIVPPQILLQMFRNEARSLTSSTVRILLGWSMRNRFSDSQFFAGQTTYAAAINAGATKDINLKTGEQPELDAAAAVFIGFADEARGSQGFWSPTPDQWLTVQAAMGSDTVPANVGAPTFISTYPRQYVYFPSVGDNPTYRPRFAPSFLFVRKRPAGEAAVITLNN